MNIKDYIHYYLGRWFQTPNSDGQINSVTLDHIYDMIDRGKEVKPVLRRLNSITDAECAANAWTDKKGFERFTEANKINGTNFWYAEDFHYLLSLGIDLFGLIDAGLAIDAATINQ